MRPALAAFCCGVAGLVLAVVFVAIGDLSSEPSDHPAWLVEGSGPVLAAYGILMGFCLPGFFIHFVLLGMIPQMLGYDAIAGRPGDALNYVTYPIVQGALYGGIVWLMTSLGRIAQEVLSRWIAPPGATTPDASSGRRSCQWSRWRLLGVVAILLILYSGVCLYFFLTPSVPTWWTADYDKQRYSEIYSVIKADGQYLIGKSLDDVTKELGLAEVPWDEHESLQSAGTDRIYHFRGFALYVFLEPLPSAIVPRGRERSWTSKELRERGVRRLVSLPFVRIDGISDGKERMRRYWKAVDEESERINARMQQERKRNQG